MNLSKAKAMVRTNLGFDFGIKEKLNRKKDEAMVAFFRKALAIPAVQQVCADAFYGSTPMCRVMNEAIESALDDNRHSVDADNIDGLERMIEDTFESMAKEFEVDADKVSGIDEAIGSAIENLKEEIADTVIAAIAEKLSR